ncbi:MAG: hypothetical protein WCI73_05970, partial [Phycisphaerae bacterium]
MSKAKFGIMVVILGGVGFLAWYLAGLATPADRAAIAATTSAPASATTPTTRPNLQPRHDLPGLSNFAQVSPNLYRGAQPTAEGFRQLKKMGIKTVVNLRAWHTDRDELKGTGLRYVQIPCNA